MTWVTPNAYIAVVFQAQAMSKAKAETQQLWCLGVGNFKGRNATTVVFGFGPLQRPKRKNYGVLGLDSVHHIHPTIG